MGLYYARFENFGPPVMNNDRMRQNYMISLYACGIPNYHLTTLDCLTWELFP